MNISKLFRRFWAYYFDNIIVAGIYAGILIVLKMFGVSISLQGVLEQNYTDLVTFYLTYGLLFLVYEISFLCSSLSATPGKLILGLEVVCYNQGSLFKVFIRSLVKVIATLISFVPFIFFLIAAFTENKQSPHDIIASTLVVRKNNAASKKINNINLIEEMQKRGINTYSEQLALASELNGTSKNTASASYSWLGLLILVIAIFCSVSFITLSFSDFINYAQKVSVSQPRYKDNGLKVEESIANKYVGSWISSDKTVGFRVYYNNETGTMYINSSKRGLKFRFDSSNTLFVTDGNNNEFKIKLSNNSLIMTRPLNGQLEIRFVLRKVEE